MRTNGRLIAALGIVLLGRSAGFAEDVDLAVVHRIRAEAFERSKVMDHLFWLTDANGPRLSGSPGFRAAADWAVGTLKQWGAANAGLETWGSFGRGWSVSRFSAHMLEPAYAPLPGVPKAWTAGTKGPVAGAVVYAPLFTKEEPPSAWDVDALAARIRRYADEHNGKLRGKVVLFDTARELELPKEAAGRRYEPDKLAAVAEAPELGPPVPYEWPITRLPADAKQRARLMASLPLEVMAELWERPEHLRDPLNAFLRDEGVLAVLTTDNRGDGAIVFAENAGSWRPGSPTPPPVVVLAPEPYSRLARLVEHGIPVKVEVELQARFHEDSLDGVNVVAEIPGGSKRDEVVMLGAHLDSWHGGTGATDNAAGSAVVLEAFRILKTLGLPLARTVRLALWSGEEQGIYGSRGYVKRHFADPLTMAVQPEHAQLAGYFNIDNGSGKVRGVYLQGNDMVRPIFQAWLAPFQDLGATTLSIRNTGGTDHLSFDAVGLPGFQFIQDPLDYGTRTHHSNVDVADHVLPGDLMQASAVLASFVYNAATRPEMLPRKPLPPPLPRKRALPAGAPD